MGKMLDALLALQAVERQLTQVKRRMQTRKGAVAAQERKIDQLQNDYEALHQRSMAKRARSDELALELKQREEHVAKLRLDLNSAKTNKEYAAILTQINTFKADNSKFEEEALKVMQVADSIQADAEKVRQEIEAERQRLEEIRAKNEEELARLNSMLDELVKKRTEAAGAVPKDALAVFERIAHNYEGEAMAPIEVHGKKPPHTYVCGGCFMGLNAEHANALRVRDEIRTCDNCGRILYLESQPEKSPA